jgi:hypothetical protein
LNSYEIGIISGFSGFFGFSSFFSSSGFSVGIWSISSSGFSVGVFSISSSGFSVGVSSILSSKTGAPTGFGVSSGSALIDVYGSTLLSEGYFSNSIPWSSSSFFSSSTAA